MNINQIFSNFEGIWEISRTINLEGHLNRYKGNGLAKFVKSSKASNLLKYSEKLILQDTIFKTKTTSVQLYKYGFDTSLNIISKYFKDGRHFYDLNFCHSNAAKGKHLCINDSYIADYVFTEKQFFLTYSVFGPEKNYTIITDYKYISYSNLYS